MSINIADQAPEAPVSSPSEVKNRQRRLAVLTSTLLVIWGIASTPFANSPWVPIPGYMTAFGTAMFVTNILLAALLFNRGLSERSSDTVKLGTVLMLAKN